MKIIFINGPLAGAERDVPNGRPAIYRDAAGESVRPAYGDCRVRGGGRGGVYCCNVRSDGIRYVWLPSRA